jgi:hypothetical protein
LGVPVRLTFEPPHVPAVQVWRIGLGKKFVKRLASNDVGIHRVFSPPVHG